MMPDRSPLLNKLDKNTLDVFLVLEKKIKQLERQARTQPVSGNGQKQNGKNGQKIVGATALAPPVSSITVEAGSDSVDLASFQTSIDTLTTEINTIKNALNVAIAAMRRYGITL
jgi:hypothetical protein